MAKLEVMHKPTGEELKAQGQALAWEKEGEEWHMMALNLLENYAKSNPEVRGDEFHTYCTQQKLGEPHCPNVWGSLFSHAGRKKWMVKSGRYATSKHVAAHAHTYVIWYSRICPADQQLEVPTFKRYEDRIRALIVQLGASNSENALLKGQVAELKAEVSALTRPPKLTTPSV